MRELCQFEVISHVKAHSLGLMTIWEINRNYPAELKLDNIIQDERSNWTLLMYNHVLDDQ